MVTGLGGGSAAWTAGTVKVSGGHLAYHRIPGNGPALMLSHGLTDNGLCWGRVAETLAPDFDIVMLDAIGHGTSSRMPVDTTHDPGQDIAEAFEALGLDSPIVMGHSVGARATAAFASANPGKVSRVILEDPPLLPLATHSEILARRHQFRQQVETLQALSDDAILQLGRKQSPLWHVDEFPPWVLGKRQVDPEAMPGDARPWQELLAAISVPTLLIYGKTELGGLVSPETAKEAMRLNPQIRAVQIRHAGHNIRRENFRDFISAVREFLNEGSVSINIGEMMRVKYR